MEYIIEQAKKLYPLEECCFTEVSEHNCGRNRVFVCSLNGQNKYVLRISSLDDRTYEEYLGEAEFVNYLSLHGAHVAGAISSLNGHLVETIESDGRNIYIVLFEYAEGILISENGYRYRDGAPLREYFYNTGKTLGIIHRLSKSYVPQHGRASYFKKYNNDYINRLIPDSYKELKNAIFERFALFRTLPTNNGSFGLIHFDFNDGNYHIDMENGNITVFDFDNSLCCWYMFDIATVWLNGQGWCMGNNDTVSRRKAMDEYFHSVMSGYRSETEIDDGLLEMLPLFIDMVLIENITDEFECAKRDGHLPDEDDITDAANALINRIPYAGFFENTK